MNKKSENTCGKQSNRSHKSVALRSQVAAVHISKINVTYQQRLNRLKRSGVASDGYISKCSVPERHSARMSEIKTVGYTWMAKCNQLKSLPFKGLIRNICL